MPVKGWAPAGMPYAPLGRETLVGDPDMGAQVPDFIIINDGFGESDHLEDHDVPAVRENKGPLVADGGVISSG